MEKKYTRPIAQVSPNFTAPPEIHELADWTLKDIIRSFGTAPSFLDWLKATKAIEEIEEKSDFEMVSDAVSW